MARRFRDRVRAQHGFTLIEVLVSALIVTLIATAVAGALITNTDIVANQNSRSEAETLAQQDQERLKGLSAEQLDNLSQTYAATEAGVKYTVTSKAWYLNSTNGQSCTTSGGAGATYFKTISTVTQTNAAGVTQTLATDESVITPPAGGSILAQFHDQTASPLSGVSVAASGPDTAAATSDVNGCVIFSALTSGNYNLTYTDVGYVDPNGNGSPLSDTATVASTGLAAPAKGNPLELGLAGGVYATFVTSSQGMPSGYTNPYAAAADGLSWFSSGGAGIPMANYRTHSAATSSNFQTTNVAGATGTGLFPFVSSQNPVSYTNNYQVWAGTCRQEQPPAGYDLETVGPGQTAGTSLVPTPVTTPALELTVSGKTTTPTDVKFTFTDSTSTCTDNWTPSWASGVTGPSGSRIFGVPFASNATSGTTASASGQTGSVVVCADYKSGSSTYYVAKSTPIYPGFTAPSAVSLALTTTGTKC